jgi:hypothetical protein
MLHTPVEIVNPGGTGRPAFVISAKPDPLPPRTSFIVRSPSAFRFPKKYTYLAAFPLLPGRATALTALTSARATDALRGAPALTFARPPFRADFAAFAVLPIFRVLAIGYDSV